nr:hypothetical protein [Tanacetum cinerariifolium]
MAFGGNTRDENPIRTFGDYSKPSREGYRNTIELPVGNDVAPLWSDTIQLNAGLSKFEANFKQHKGMMTNKIGTVLKAITITICPKQLNKSCDDKSKEEEQKEKNNSENIDTTTTSPLDPPISFITEQVRKLNSFLKSSDLVPRSTDTKFVCSKDDGHVMFIEIIRKYNYSHEEGPEDEGNTKIEGLEVEYFDTFLTRSELAYHKDHPPMLAPGRYPQWRSRLLRYVDTRPNGEALRKCILSGPYKPTTMLVHAVEATDDSPAVPEHTTVEMPTNMSPENKAYFLVEKEAIHLILTGYEDEIYSTIDACQTAHEMWEEIERL